MIGTAAANAAVVLALMTDAQKTNPASTWEDILNYVWSNVSGRRENQFSPGQDDTSLRVADVNGIGAALLAAEVNNAPDLESVGTIVLTNPYTRGGNSGIVLDLYPY